MLCMANTRCGSAMAKLVTVQSLCCCHVANNSRLLTEVCLAVGAVGGALSLYSGRVVPYGSVPLKTYLTDGDIDLTIFVSPHSELRAVIQIFYSLKIEQHKEDAVFEVKDVQFINAEVKIIKCLIQDVVVDISFNQIGGLGALCFLEKVDYLLAENHLIKCSILLIKAWCYYESHILGAYHGLLATYALEILVLYIINHFHSSLTGPFAVLYKFLDYYSKFDWKNYCITLSGPVPISSLPKLLVEPPVTNGGGTLIRADLLKEYLLLFSAPFNDDAEHQARDFSLKYLNIVDPLRESNNLGRSVGIGNFQRIVSAFTLGAHKLSSALQSNQEDIAIGINKFFENTLHRHQKINKQNLLYASLYGQDEQNASMSSKSVEPNTLKDSGKQVMKNAGTHASYKSIVMGISKTYGASDFKALTGDFELHFGNFLCARLCMSLANDFHHTPSQWSLAQDRNKEYLHAVQRQNLMCYLRPDQLFRLEVFLPTGFYLEMQPFTPSDSHDKDALNKSYGTEVSLLQDPQHQSGINKPRHALV
ncbi:hypothetical protein J5N97_014693 [Dioscorea zingiberensis]|uniref:PAP/OAS1 substrate-binding-related domain-containing protein n=1 Tax=Dioscorea zingiberensis TaxID=325984 RepID=A0A9D5HJW1_9LILI|nr:hypothetical protein J5N97_014693 [Dioscorea zingiberensis]